MTLQEIAAQFAIEKPATSIEPLGEGFINDTYKVFAGGASPSYILQRKNHIIFPDVPAMMENIRAVTDHIRAKGEITLDYLSTHDGKLYANDDQGNFWTMMRFIEGSKSYDRADTPQLAYQGGLGLGLFHKQVADFNQPLHEVIKGFHNIKFRFAQWDAALGKDLAHRVKKLSTEIDWIESRRAVMLDFWHKFETGYFPMRVTHNDTKISNFLFGENSGKVLCAIDLDTMMSSTLLNDTGDALRSYTNTGAEDDPNPDKVSMSQEMFESYMSGYLSQMKDSLTKAELEYLAFSGIYITYEQVLRFLMDYINGDTYYKVKYHEHNLVRTHAQYRLLLSMESQQYGMKSFIEHF